MRILLFGTYDTAAHPRVAVLRDGLVAGGAEVTEVNASLGLSTAQRVRMLQDPRRLPVLAWRLLVCWTSLVRQVRRLRRGGHRVDAVVVGYLGHFDVLLARRLFRDVPVVLDFLIGASDTAADRGVAGGWRQRLLRRLDDAALGSADVVVVDTEEHRTLLPETHRPRAVVVPVGATAPWYAAAETAAETAAEDAAGPREDDRLGVVFFGLFTPLQGTPVIGEALAALADAPVRVTMIGTGQDHDETRALAAANPHVTWLDWVEGRDLPGVVASHDVCLGIFGTGPKALRVVPTKVFQGAAAGCALLTSDTAPQRRMLGDAAAYVPAGDGPALAEALRSLATDRTALQRTRAATRTLARERFVPERVVAPLRDALTDLTTRT